MVKRYQQLFLSSYNGVIVSLDPVAADRIGLEIVEHYRRLNRLPSLEDAGRPAKYLATAEKAGLGIADLEEIELKVIVSETNGGEEPDDTIIREGTLFDG